jgi:hypothetical protein
MKKLNRYLLLLFGSILGPASFAQTESTLYFMNSLSQVVDVNPAIMPRYKISVGLPLISSFGAIYSNNGFSYNDFTTKVNGVMTADLSKWTSSLADKNYVTMSMQTDLLRVGVRIHPKTYFMFSSTLKGYNRAMIPKGLATLAVDGTAPLVGSFSNTAPQEEGILYYETAAGLSFQVNDRLTIGGRLKYIKGLANITTESSSLVVQVADAYQITATGSADIRTSGIYNLGQSGYKVGDHFGDYLKNSGWGVDLGATFQVMDRLTLGASLVDIGYVKWMNNTYQYTLDPAKAKYTFQGVDINQLVNNNTSYINAQGDSIQAKFKMKETPMGAYTTMLPAKMYLSGKFDINDNLSVGALFFSESFRGRYASGLTASLNKNFGKVLSTSVSYTVSNRSYNNLGLGISLNLSPFQFYIVGDNLLRAPVSLVASQNLNSYINSSQLLTIRTGLNIVFGWDKGLVKVKGVEDDSHNPRKNSGNKKVTHTIGRPTRKRTR